MRRPTLPIDEVIPQLRASLAEETRLVLQAPPGAGKTTAVPLALVGESWSFGSRIVMLEPRRLAARAAARRMSAVNNQPVGRLVGFRVRGESQVGPETRVEVVTEGVLTRMLVSDPTLEGVAAVIFDEFHERSVVADVGLALTLRTAELVRPDLRIVVMSATLDGERVSALLGGARVVTAAGRAFPVDTRWLPPRGGQRPLEMVPATVRRALEETDGDVLAFLPGAGEIRRAFDALDGSMPSNIRLFALHGSMPAEEQDAAVAASPPGTRKVVLATSIAETSLTIEGVTAVVDSGLARVPRFDIRSGMTRLETVRITQDAAEQRRGRAGRTAPGTCYRLWSEGDHAALLARRTPEILSADLAPLALDLALAGVDDISSLAWLDQPPAAALAQARELLVDLEALDAAGIPTEHGRRMATLGLHPRLAHLVLAGAARGEVRLACDVAALLGERDVLRSSGTESDPDLGRRISVLKRDGSERDELADRGRVMRVRDESRRIFERVRDAGVAAGASDAQSDSLLGELLALAYPDRVALAAGKRGRFRMRNGRGAIVGDASPLAGAEALAIAETDGARDDARVYLAAPLTRTAIERIFATQFRSESESRFDAGAGAVLESQKVMLGALVFDERTVPARDPEVLAAGFAAHVAHEGLAAIPWTDGAVAIRRRLAFLHAIDPAWPDVSDTALLAQLDAWLAPLFHSLKRWQDLEKADLGGALIALVPPKLRRDLDRLAPTHIAVATGSRIPVDYSDARAPVLAVRLQELFGVASTPAVAGGKVPVTLHLLSPAGRPLQVTRDLGGFWRGSYAEVRKEMRGRYPRHAWPDDPLTAPATRRAKPRRPE